MAEHGTTTRYRNGCRCTSCRKANRERAYRSKSKSKAETVAPVVQIGTATAPPMGDNEAAWRRQCEISDRADDLPIVLAQGATLSRILDDPEQWRYHAQASRQLQILTTKLVGTSRKSRSKGRLASVQKMVSHNSTRWAANG